MRITVNRIAESGGRNLQVWAKKAETDAEADAIMRHVETVIGDTFSNIESITITTTLDISAL